MGKGGRKVEDLSDLYESYANDVKHFLICLTSNVDLAEELTQETFYQALKSIKRYNGECKMSVWLCQIAKHTYYNYLKKEKRNNMIYMDMDNPSNANLPDDEIIKRNTLIAIHKEIHLLHEPYREIFLLRTSIHLSFKEIGEIFDKSENWARVTYYRAKLKLVERIQGDAYEL
ncbi:sigma-70 family RNA polymerase sigma factor [Lysinibacillus macroides]|uniref:RNA polymerase sigma factor sigM n=1 Tax=Lysinibacillus macroides TaxID=33935 RepID=A0A0M9DNU1_9BACI|nr:RNA polymerase sigma factor sigM [Lysinibacillus macroides]QPR70441.1 sigma-70 family RNA polymerase sigma factor [Lysinibacillus macroides]